jgi:anion-transporting  ArsA/GET3 family ATPase
MSISARRASTTPENLDVDKVLGDVSQSIIVCCGSGGVGKTTTAAALALRAAEQGRQVVVLTIDPARRLAQSMGLQELDNVPRQVPGVDTSAGGSLDAMMLDMKRTFDEVVVTHAAPGRAKAILENPFYKSLSANLAGTQEYMAMERLAQLRGETRWDLIVVDTPPSRSALDFLDAPQRLGSFLDGRFIRVLMSGARTGGRGYVKVLGVGVNAVNAAMTRILGAQMLKEIQSFAAAFETMFGGFRERAETTYRLLQASGTSFLVIATPERDALREAAYFVDRLSSERMPLTGLVLNRVHPPAARGLSAARALGGAETLSEMGDHELTAALLRMHADNMRIADRESRLRERFAAAHPRIPVVEVPAQAGDVHDIEGLRLIGKSLSASTS